MYSKMEIRGIILIREDIMGPILISLILNKISENLFGS